MPELTSAIIIRMEKKQLPKVGFIGQGWIGKNYSDDLDNRGFNVVRFAKEEPYIQNGEKIKDCDIVFIAVPTPTTTEGFDDSIVRSVMPYIGKGKTAVIKSTLIPGTTENIQKDFPDIFVLHSPEFLSVKTATEDAKHPVRNIVGIPVDNEEYKTQAELVMSVLPEAEYSKICSSREAELIKYGRNIFGYVRVVLLNLFYDLGQELKVDWNVIEEAMSADEFNGSRYMKVVDQKGRGAGGACFIKDYASFKRMYESVVGDDTLGKEILNALEKKNIELLKSTNKNLDLLKDVYGI